jgi:hypothetical protein
MRIVVNRYKSTLYRLLRDSHLQTLENRKVVTL